MFAKGETADGRSPEVWFVWTPLLTLDLTHDDDYYLRPPHARLRRPSCVGRRASYGVGLTARAGSLPKFMETPFLDLHLHLTFYLEIHGDAFSTCTLPYLVFRNFTHGRVRRFTDGRALVHLFHIYIRELWKQKAATQVRHDVVAHAAPGSRGRRAQYRGQLLRVYHVAWDPPPCTLLAAATACARPAAHSAWRARIECIGAWLRRGHGTYRAAVAVPGGALPVH